MTKTLRRLTILIAVCMALALLAGCSSPFGESLEVTVIPPPPLTLLEQDDLDIIALRSWAEASVRELLPRAYYQGMVYFGESGDLSRLRGRLVFVFGQRTPRLFRRGFLTASVTIHTETGQAEIWYVDRTGRYWNMDPWRVPDGAHIRQVVSIAEQYLVERDASGCVIGLTDGGDRWYVRCYPDGITCSCLCLFEIVDGKIHEQRETRCRDNSS